MTFILSLIGAYKVGGWVAAFILGDALDPEYCGFCDLRVWQCGHEYVTAYDKDGDKVYVHKNCLHIEVDE